MFRQENSSLSAPKPNGLQANGKTYNRKLYASITGLAVILIIITALMISQPLLLFNIANGSDENGAGSGSLLDLNLNYSVGEHMTYDTTNIITNQMVNTSLSLSGITNSQSYNSTLTLDIISSGNENYRINETITTSPSLFSHPLPPITINVSKESYYNNFVAPGGPLIFYNSSSNPTISAYLAQPTVKIGDVWKIPVNTGNASLGLTGEVRLTFAGLQDVTVPAGTFQAMRIEVTSNVLSLHSDGSSIIKVPDGMTLQLNGTSYIEQGTCRLIKADLTQLTTTNSLGIGGTSTLFTEKTLVEFTKP
jgi:hypothetical protein